MILNIVLLILVIIIYVILTLICLFHMMEYMIYKHIWGRNKKVFPSEKKVEIV